MAEVIGPCNAAHHLPGRGATSTPSARRYPPPSAAPRNPSFRSGNAAPSAFEIQGMIKRTNDARPLMRAGCRLALPFLLLSFATFAYSQERPSIFLDDLTWTELRDEIAAGKTTIIVPIGGTEQSGPAMALGKHNRSVKLLSERIAVSLGNAIVAPRDRLRP